MPAGYEGSCHKISDVEFPSETLLLAEMWECAYWSGAPLPGQYSTYQASLFMNYQSRMPTFDVHRNNDIANYLFCDSHVVAIPADDPNIGEETEYYYFKLEKE